MKEKKSERAVTPEASEVPDMGRAGETVSREQLATWLDRLADEMLGAFPVGKSPHWYAYAAAVVRSEVALRARLAALEKRVAEAEELMNDSVRKFEDIEARARDLKGRIDGAPLDDRRAVATIANLAHVGAANIQHAARRALEEGGVNE